MKIWLTIYLLAATICAHAKPPNIVFIVGDYIGCGDFSCYGIQINATPHIDVLAAKGLRFTDHHSERAMASRQLSSCSSRQSDHCHQDSEDLLRWPGSADSATPELNRHDATLLGNDPYNCHSAQIEQ